MAKCNKDLWCKWSEGINTCKLQGKELGQDITCQEYGTKRKCKTSNEELAKMVKQGIDNKIFEEKCIIILKAAEALQFIHDKGILHGDIKPDNIVIQKEIVDNTNKYLVKFIDVGSSRIFMNSKMYKLKLQTQELSEEVIDMEFLRKIGIDNSVFKTDSEEAAAEDDYFYGTYNSSGKQRNVSI